MNEGPILIVGAGPAGLSAAWNLVRAGRKVTILEREPVCVGGLARTMQYKGFRFDVGAHRFFSTNPEITRWWQDRLPGDFMRVKRLTRILYRRRFLHYPLHAREAFFGLGWRTSLRCLWSFLWRQLNPIQPARSFEDWVSNHFGDALYDIFFKTYTEKVWGMPCSKISADWASQRIKGLSLGRAVLDAFGFCQLEVKTLAQEFDYPRFGAGMMWERTRDEITNAGGKVIMGREVVRIERKGKRIEAIISKAGGGVEEFWPVGECIVSMPLQDCVLSMFPPMDEGVRNAAEKLRYRDLVFVVLIVNRTELFPDNWIYVHDPAVKVGRITNYNNWTKEMASNMTCLELEYFCSRGDAFWGMNDEEILSLAKVELEKLGLAVASEILDGCVVRVEKAYPVYDRDYRQNVDVIREALSKIENLHPVGRNGMHKYNNQDHSMLTGMLAAQNALGENHDLWGVNTDCKYQEGERLAPVPIGG
jgi:protoporphyrinogen oxidase